LRHIKFAAAAFAALTALAGLESCSTVMAANRPEPTDLSQFTPREKRIEVVGKLGHAEGTVKDGARECDTYSLYTKGPGQVAKAGMVLGYAAADFFTLGLSEAVTTPIEAGTKAGKHAVLMCYDESNRLVSLIDNGQPRFALADNQTTSETNAKAALSPAAVPAAAAP
jgi:hypothetical protein